MNTTTPSDLYALILEVKCGTADGGKRGCVAITKKQAKKSSIPWSFVISAVQILGLTIYRNGRDGYIIANRGEVAA